MDKHGNAPGKDPHPCSAGQELVYPGTCYSSSPRLWACLWDREPLQHQTCTQPTFLSTGGKVSAHSLSAHPQGRGPVHLALLWGNCEMRRKPSQSAPRTQRSPRRGQQTGQVKDKEWPGGRGQEREGGGRAGWVPARGEAPGGSFSPKG